MKILAFESSCDDTGVAIYDAENGLLANELHSQIELHQEYGGVVPELASRDHIRKIVPLVRQAFNKADIKPKDIDAIAYTQGPGLAGALLVGASFARSLAWAWDIPSVGVHHLEGHLLAPMLEANPPSTPFVGLLVSGGHTQLIEVAKIGSYKLLGQTLDDAAGEAFDKIAKLLGLPYPGGPSIAKLAKKGDPKRFKFPRPMTNRKGLDFSFSGLKTYTLNTWEKYKGDEQSKADIARAFQDAVIDTLAIKCKRAIEQTNLKTLVVSGGVGANEALREKLQKTAEALGAKVYFPRPEFCTDNAAMIAFAGYQRLLAGHQDDLEISIKPRWPLEDL